MNEDAIIFVDPVQERAEFESLGGRENPWEAVIYFAAVGEKGRARELRDKLLQTEKRKLQDELLQGQTLTDGVLISGPDTEGRCIVGVGGRRYDVELAIEPKPSSDELIPGREVWVHPDTMAIAKLRDTYIQGEAAPVIEVVESGETADEEETDAEDETGHDDSVPKRLLLKVKSRQEEIVVEAVPALARLEPAVGDTVRILSTLGVALDLLSRGRGDVLLGELPDVEYQDIGGLDVEIARIREAIEEPYVYPTVFQRYDLQRPRGILLYGPPGCGKTMIAKAIANNLSQQIEHGLREIQAALQLYVHLRDSDDVDDINLLYQQWRNRLEGGGSAVVSNQMPTDAQGVQIELERFLRSRGVTPARAARELRRIEFALEQGGQSYFVSIKGPELLSKWVGETESSIRGIFAMARERATFYTPVVLFFDELESMFSRRGSGISSDVQKTIVPQLLAEIDGIEETRHVIVIGASNRFDLIDPAVLRPGRLDFKIEIPRPNRDREAPRSILAKYLTPDVPFPPTELKILPAARDALGEAAVESAALADCLAAAIDGLIKEAQDLQAALFLTDLYADGRLLARKLNLCATSGIDPEVQESVIETWGADAGIAWEVVRSGKEKVQEVDSASEDGQRGVSAWPIMAPDDSGLVWGVLVVGHPVPELPEVVHARVDALVPAIATAIQVRREMASRLIERILNILFHDESRLVITELIERQRAIQQMKREPRTLEKQVREIISGAMLASIVSRAKRAAVKREIQQKAYGSTGVTWSDLYQAIHIECEEGKDQYIFELYGDDPYGRGQAYHDMERFHVDVILPLEHEVGEYFPWLTHKAYAWREPSAKNVPLADEDEQ